MKFLILALLAIAGTLAEENYDGPEYAIKDYSMSMQPEESLGLWNRIDEPLYKPPNDRHRRIVGGHEAVPHSIPWQVFLSSGLFPQIPIIRLCGGTVISTNAVLTAGYCLGQTFRTEVIAGAHNRLIIEPSQQRRTVASAFYRIHPDTAIFPTRLAILIMQEALTFNSYVQAVRLPNGFEGQTFAGERATLSGWGITGHLEPMSDVLRVVEVPVISNAECLRVFDPQDVDDNTLCTSMREGTGACLGDMGGPLTYIPTTGDPRPILISTFIASLTCADSDRITPQRHARITKFLPWIMANH